MIPELRSAPPGIGPPSGSVEPQMFVVAQLGGRMHHAVARILHAAGMLERFYTDLVAVRGWPALVRALGTARGTDGVLLYRSPDGEDRIAVGVARHGSIVVHSRAPAHAAANAAFAACRPAMN